MLERAAGGGGWFLEVSLIWALATTAGCGGGGDDAGPVAVARSRLVRRPPVVHRTMRPLTRATGSHPGTRVRENLRNADAGTEGEGGHHAAAFSTRSQGLRRGGYQKTSRSWPITTLPWYF